jgi:ADP-ribose pyrophosphatase
MKYSVVSSEKVFEGKVFTVRIDELEKETGEKMRIDVVEHGGAVVLIPMDESGDLLLVRQYRHPTGTYILEFPAGTLDVGESPEECAIRECREEVGMAPGTIKNLGGFFLAPGYSTEYLQIYLATDLSEAPLPQDLDEDLTVERLPADELLEKIKLGEVQDAKTIAGMMMLNLHGGSDPLS